MSADGGATREEALEVLRTIPLFQVLDDADLAALARASKLVTGAPSQVIARQGEPGDDVLVVSEGRLWLVTLEDTEERFVASLGAGAVIGASHAVLGGERAASVVAETACVLVSLPRDVVEAVALRHRELMAGLTELVRHGLQRDLLVSVLPKIFGPMGLSTLEELAARATWVTLRRGEAPFRQGDPSNAWYVVASGRLQVIATDEAGNETVIAEIGRGESLGDLELLSSLTRTATPYAIRDSELIRFSAEDFEALVTRNSRTLLTITRKLVRRSLGVEQRSKPPTCTNVAVVPLHPGVKSRELTRRIASELARIGPTLHLGSEHLPEPLRPVKTAAEAHPAWLRFSAWLDDRAVEHRFIVLEGDHAATPWTRRALAEADEVLLVADATSDPRPTAIEQALLGPGARHARRTLVLVHPAGASLPRGTARWLDARNVQHHQHLRDDRPGDVERLARTLGGAAISLVLGAGGARGFAHVGTLRALADAGIPIDYVGGTSIGAFVAGMHAMGKSPAEMMEFSRRVVAMRPFGDYTLPITSVLRGNRVERITELAFGATDIEDLWSPYFCTSCDISRFRDVVFDRGNLGEAILASVALPGVLPPRIRNGHMHVDGGTTDVLPGEVMRARSRGKLIAVDVSTERELVYPLERYPTSWSALWKRLRPSGPVPLTLPELFMRAVSFGVARRTAEVARDADLFLRPPVERYGTVEIGAMSTIEHLGYTHARERLDDLSW